MTDNPEPASAPEAASPGQGCVCGGRGPDFSRMLQMMMPSDAAGEHFRNAGLEFLKGFRELLDQRIQSLSQKQNKGTKLNVE
jgi:hypothetical protein